LLKPSFDGTSPIDRFFVLPPGYRPELRMIFATRGNDGGGVTQETPTRIDVLADGSVQRVLGGKDAYVSLDNISFPAAP
jgi:hypothetical protein